MTNWMSRVLVVAGLCVMTSVAGGAPATAQQSPSPSVDKNAIVLIPGVSLVGIALPFTAAGAALGFTPLPPLYWPLVASMLLTYSVLTHLVKVWFVRRWGM
jgi:hypothetical protein